MLSGLIAALVILSIGLIILVRNHFRLQIECNRAIQESFVSRQGCNLLTLEIAILRFTRDLERVPRSMSELRGRNPVSHDFIDPFTGRAAMVNDQTGLRDWLANPYDLTFRYIPVDVSSPLDERCVISMHDESGRPSRTCLIFTPTKVLS